MKASLKIHQSGETLDKNTVDASVVLKCESNFTRIAVFAKSLDDNSDQCAQQQIIIPLMQDCNRTAQKTFSGLCDNTNYEFAVIWGDINVKCNISDYKMHTTPPGEYIFVVRIILQCINSFSCRN